MQVGEYEVRELTVNEGLDLLTYLNDENQFTFQKELILRAVSRNGAPIREENFASVMPVLGELISTAMKLNGFSKEE